MKPSGLLIQEHEHIKKIIRMMKGEIRCIRRTARVDVDFIDTAADFIGNYVGQVHHAKEDMLFHALLKKKISDDDFMMMSGLLADHQAGRNIMDELLKAKAGYTNGDTSLLTAIVDGLNAFVTFYPKHLKAEENVFFPRSERYFTDDELDTMLRKFQDFNEAIIRQNREQFKHKTYDDKNKSETTKE